MKKREAGMIGTGSVLVGITAILSDAFYPDASAMTKTLMLGLASGMGGWLGARWFNEKEEKPVKS